MSKNKRWYYLKLAEDFLESDPIEWLLTQEEGSKYFALYIMLCKIALKTDGNWYGCFVMKNFRILRKI